MQVQEFFDEKVDNFGKPVILPAVILLLNNSRLGDLMAHYKFYRIVIEKYQKPWFLNIKIVSNF